MTATDALAARLLAARRLRQPLVASADDGPADAAQAYEVQWRVAQALSGHERIAHWKVGAASREQTPQAAPIPAPYVLPSPARWANPPTTQFSIEAEVVFRVARDFTAGRAAVSSVGEVFDCALAAIEVCDTRLAAQPAPDARWKLADALSNAGLVVGNGQHAPDAIDYSRLRCVVEVDGSPRFEAIGTHPLGNPCTLLPWWLAFASARAPLRSGDLVTTGSWCGMLQVAAGAKVVVQFEGLGRAEVEFAG